MVKFQPIAFAVVLVACTATESKADGSISVGDPIYPGYQTMAEITFANTKGDAECGYEPVEGEASRVVASCKLDSDDEVCAWRDGGTKCFIGPANGRVIAYKREGSGMQMFWRFEAADRSESFEFDEFSIGVFAE